jgi:hypothetical protein
VTVDGTARLSSLGAVDKRSDAPAEDGRRGWTRDVSRQIGYQRREPSRFEVIPMADEATLAEIDRRIQIVEDNLRQLIEQAAAYSGAADEERNADRIAEQQAKLDALLAEREALLK